MSTNDSAAGWLQDDPIRDEEGSEDRLDRGGFADVAAGILANLASGDGSSVVAVIGPWGSGKSSLLNMIRRRLASAQTHESAAWIEVEFNPWYYADQSSLQAGFFRELRAALPKSHSWRRARRNLAIIGRVTAPLATLFSGIGVNLQGVIKAATDWLRSDEPLSQAYRNLNRDLLQAKRPLLVILDDLDRLSPDELLLVFKLLRLTGRLSNVHYLITYDEKTLVDVLTRTGLVNAGERRRAIEYLDKIVQVRLDVPPMRSAQIQALLNVEIGAMAESAGYVVKEGALQRFTRAYYAVLRKNLSSPRALLRFLSQARAFLPKSSIDFDLEDYLLLSWIRSSEPLLYSSIQANRSNLVADSNAHWPTARSQKGGQPVRAFWVQIFEDANIETHHQEAIASLLGDMFPLFSRDWSANGDLSNLPPVPAPRIGNDMYFDRYFHFSVPDDDISDRAVRDAYSQMGQEGINEELRIIESLLLTQPDLVLNKLADAHAASVTGGVAFLNWLGRHYGMLPQERGILTPRDRMRSLGYGIFADLSSDEQKSVLAILAEFPGGLAVASSWVYAVLDPSSRYWEPDGEENDFHELQRFFVGLLKQEFAKRQSIPPLDWDNDSWGLVWDWRRYDELGLRVWIEGRFAQSQWSPLDAVARLVKSSVLLGVPGAKFMLAGLDINLVEELYGVSWVMNQLHVEIDNAEESFIPERSLLDTPENRRAYALQQLKFRRDGEM
ncbi:type II secretory pathway predicted ATPase ExeA [Clavibacter michiganensis]|uniref:KAP family P-loop NTPase fold protein n=1 Tax=Clavibacter michiganensis TaxID=28447 RepID=UPI00195F0217|nr:P-loop NTPase fold protein [Clavibacter michiganensis]MBM7411889.1 type II secretory pathway predicted ATPase ExeA [Clavibacter michiganensis]